MYSSKSTSLFWARASLWSPLTCVWEKQRWPLHKGVWTGRLKVQVNTLLKKIKGTFWYHDLYWTLSLKEVPGLCQTHVFLNINDLSEVQLCMSSNSWTWECPHTKDGADHVPLIFLSNVSRPLQAGHIGQVMTSLSRCLQYIYFTAPCKKCDVFYQNQTFGQKIKTELVIDESRDLQLYNDSFLIQLIWNEFWNEFQNLIRAKAELCNF